MDKFIVNYTENGLRLDKVLALNFNGKSRTYLTSLIEEGNVFVNDNIEKASYKVKTGDNISVNIPETKELTISKEDIPLNIVYEDDDYLIINKPQGMVVHPSCGHYEHTLVNALLNHCTNLSGINGVIRPGIVHRIDKDTSGLICVAKNDNAHHFLSEQLIDHTMNREYIALVRGVIKENSGTIDMPIARSKQNRQKMAVTKDGKPAITNFTVLERFKENTLVRCSLVTGRTHQIRVHMSEIGYPVEGDSIYGPRSITKLYKNGQLLTAVKLTLISPSSKKEVSYEVELPEYFKQIIATLEK